MTRAIVTGLILLLLAAGGSGRAEDGQGPGALPEGAGRDEVFSWCTGCHGAQLVRNQAMSRERWDETLTWMTERQGMPELDGAERTLVLDYLTVQFGPKAGAAPASRQPFLTQPARTTPFAPR